MFDQIMLVYYITVCSLVDIILIGFSLDIIVNIVIHDLVVGPTCPYNAEIFFINDGDNQSFLEIIILVLDSSFCFI